MKSFAIFFAALVAVCSGAAVQTTWSLHELSEAFTSPNTDPALLPYIEYALNQLMASIYAGQEGDTITIGIPASLLPTNPIDAIAITPVEAIQPVPVLPTPVAPVPVLPTPVAPVPVLPIPVAPELPVSPVAVAPEAAVSVPASAESSPLVQIIININQEEQQVADVVVPAPVPAPAIIPEAVSVVDQAPEVVTVVDQAPEVVSVVPAPVNPIDVIAIVAPEMNPIDVIAVGAPEVNPIDLLLPIPSVVQPVAAGAAEVVGPIV